MLIRDGNSTNTSLLPDLSPHLLSDRLTRTSTRRILHAHYISVNIFQIPRPPSSQQAGSPSPSESNSLGALDLTPRTIQPATSSPGPSPGPSPGAPSLFSTFGLLPPGQASSPLMSSALSSLTSSVLTSTAFSPLRLAVGPTGTCKYFLRYYL